MPATEEKQELVQMLRVNKPQQAGTNTDKNTTQKWIDIPKIITTSVGKEWHRQMSCYH